MFCSLGACPRNGRRLCSCCKSTSETDPTENTQSLASVRRILLGPIDFGRFKVSEVCPSQFAVVLSPVLMVSFRGGNLLYLWKYPCVGVRLCGLLEFSAISIRRAGAK